jgi:hypothetical protein
VVCRPSDPGAFTGTVVLEWLNVSAGFDAPAFLAATSRAVAAGFLLPADVDEIVALAAAAYPLA